MKLRKAKTPKLRLQVLFTKSRPMKRRNKVLPRKAKHKKTLI